ncbi:hypothetical protein [Nostoc sp.]
MSSSVEKLPEYPGVEQQSNCVDIFAPASLISNTPTPEGLGVLRS